METSPLAKIIQTLASFRPSLHCAQSRISTYRPFSGPRQRIDRCYGANSSPDYRREQRHHPGSLEEAMQLAENHLAGISGDRKTPPLLPLSLSLLSFPFFFPHFLYPCTMETGTNSPETSPPNLVYSLLFLPLLLWCLPQLPLSTQVQPPVPIRTRAKFTGAAEKPGISRTSVTSWKWEHWSRSLTSCRPPLTEQECTACQWVYTGVHIRPW